MGTEFCDLHPEIIKSHVLSRLDGPSLGSAACCSTTIRHLSSDQKLWSSICHSTWPSTSSDSRLSHFIATFGARSFFSHAYAYAYPMKRRSSSHSPQPQELICAVDIYYKKKLIFSKTQETETDSSWFRCSPFRIDLLHPKDVVPTPITSTDLINHITLSWILIDIAGNSVVNLSSHKPVTVHRHWLTGELQLKYASILAPHVHSHILLTCGSASDTGEIHLKELCLQMEDMDGMHLNGKDSLVFLQGALHAKNRTGYNRVQHAHRRYEEYVQMKKQRRDRKLRTERVLDTFCVAFGVSIFVAFCSFMLWR